MAFTKKTWKDRISEYPTRRQLTKTDGSTDTVTVARDEGTISQEGDAFSAANMNDLEGRIAGEFENVNTDLGGNSLIYNESEDTYYIRHGADSVPKKLGDISLNSAVFVPNLTQQTAPENGYVLAYSNYTTTAQRDAFKLLINGAEQENQQISLAPSTQQAGYKYVFSTCKKNDSVKMSAPGTTNGIVFFKN